MDIYDGEERVSSLSVLCLFKNAGTYLKKFFIPMTNDLEKYYNVEFVYYIIENNSTDDTRCLLNTFISTKSYKSKFMRFDVKTDYVNVGKGINYDRISSLSNIRNKLIDNIVPLPSKWSLVIDSNIYFKVDILSRMFSVLPRKNNIGMLAPFVQQLLIHGIHINYESSKHTSNKIVSHEYENIPLTGELVNHYYDTFSFYDHNSRAHYPQCAFQKCLVCSPTRNKCDLYFKDNSVPDTIEVVDVASCFGGFVIIDNVIFNEHNIRWDTVSYNVLGESICEHVLLCFQIRKIAKKRIVLLQHIDDIYRTT
jgi:hypothetical protein